MPPHFADTSGSALYQDGVTLFVCRQCKMESVWQFVGLRFVLPELAVLNFALMVNIEQLLSPVEEEASAA